MKKNKIIIISVSFLITLSFLINNSYAIIKCENSNAELEIINSIKLAEGNYLNSNPSVFNNLNNYQPLPTFPSTPNFPVTPALPDLNVIDKNTTNTNTTSGPKYSTIDALYFAYEMGGGITNEIIEELKKYPSHYRSMLEQGPGPAEAPGMYMMRIGLLGILADQAEDEDTKQEIKDRQNEIQKETSEKAEDIDEQVAEAANQAANQTTGTQIYKQPEKISSGNSSEQSLGDMVNDADSFIKSGNLQYNQTALQTFSKTFYNIMLTAGIFVAVIVGAIIGIKFMTSGIEEKAEVKKLLVPYVVGCVVVFGGFGIWKILVTILQNI